MKTRIFHIPRTFQALGGSPYQWLCVVGMLTLACGGGPSRMEMFAAARSPESSWEYLGNSMSEAAALIESYSDDELEKREGYRLLARTLALGFDRFLEYSQSDVPEFYRLQSAHRKFAGDNPDQLYHAASIDGGRAYRIRGRWSDGVVSTELIEFGVYGGGLSFDDENAKRRLIGYLDESDLILEQGGGFEVILATQPHSGNWIRLEPDAETVLVRRYFASPQQNDRLPLEIELIDEQPPVRAMTQADLARGLLGAGAFLVETVKIWGGWYPGVLKRLGPNQIGQMEDDGTLLTPSEMVYLEGAWQIDSDEALLLSFVPPEVPYWNFLPMNIWMESLDWRVATVAVNNFSAHRAADGSVMIVVSEQNPGLPNWIGTQGHQRGLMSFRFARLGQASAPEVTTRVVPVESLRPEATE
ncbi:hypothetical protein MK489_14055 [Myxococcota bacterium]|nr:hypothetical protein [Myxococcota bacterium]